MRNIFHIIITQQLKHFSCHGDLTKLVVLNCRSAYTIGYTGPHRGCMKYVLYTVKKGWTD
jgi:hypothetical protein